MNIENELKLIPNKEVSREQIIELLAQKGIVIQKEGKMVHQEDTYFDDKDGTLEKSGGSFRIRRKKDKIAVTYKMPIESDTEYKQRKEYEITVPEEYMETGIDMQTAIELLKKQYPEIKFPEDMGEILTVINDRNKTNLVCPDGTVVEMAFDTLQGKDGDGELYHIQPEIEFETIEGNPANLTTIYETINEKFLEQTSKNTLSKYARTKKEITEQKLTLEELSACALFTQILRSTQFDKLKYKGQILHRYDKPTIPQLDNFKDFDYLVDRIKAIKKGDYKVQIPKSIVEQEGIADLLQSGTYEIKDEIDLEDMFCLLLSDVNYRVADEVLADFLDKVYFADDKAITNRLSHSQQVMLGTGLACKSEEVGTNLVERLTCMISAISHDIGHVPLSHVMENVIKKTEGFFSHESNGKRVIDIICEADTGIMIQNMQTYLPQESIDQIEQALTSKADEIRESIITHSRTNCDHRGEGPNKQIPRVEDKILYVISDIRDLIKYAQFLGKEPVDILDKAWAEQAILEMCKKNDWLYRREKLIEPSLFSNYINPIKNKKYGRTVVDIINTITKNSSEGSKQYEVEPYVWEFIKQLIIRIKDVRKIMGMDNQKAYMETGAEFLLTKMTNYYMQKFKGNKEKARQAAIDHITKMGEMDFLEYVKQMTVLSDKQLSGEEPVTDAEIAVAKKTLYNYLINLDSFKKKSEEEKAEIIAEWKGLTDEEVLTYYSRISLMNDSEKEELRKIKRTEDIQLKIKVNKKITIEDILTALNLGDGKSTVKMIQDTYYSTDTPLRTVCVREFVGKDQKALIVKDTEPKPVKELNRHKYKTTADGSCTIQEMLAKINLEHPGLNVTISSNSPLMHIKIKRTEYPREWKGVPVIFLNDYASSTTGKTLREIEISCPDASTISKIKGILQTKFGKTITFNKKSKQEALMPDKQNKPNEAPEEHDDGENR